MYAFYLCFNVCVRARLVKNKNVIKCFFNCNVVLLLVLTNEIIKCKTSEQFS